MSCNEQEAAAISAGHTGLKVTVPPKFEGMDELMMLQAEIMCIPSDSLTMRSHGDGLGLSGKPLYLMPRHGSTARSECRRMLVPRH